VDDEEAELVRGRPADVPGLAAATLVGLLHRPLDRDRDIADVGAWFAPARARTTPGATCWKRIGREHREGQDISGAIDAHVSAIQIGQLEVVSEHDRHRSRRRSAGSGEGARDDAPDRGVGQEDWGPIAPDDIDPGAVAVEAPRAVGHSREAVRRDSSSTTLFCG